MFSKQGLWYPSGERLENCDVLFVGDSIFRYLSEQLPPKIGLLVPGVKFVSGATGDTFTEKCLALVSHQVIVCVIHVGTNEVNREKDTCDVGQT